MRKLEPLRFRKTVAYVGRVSIRDRSIDVWKRLLQALYLAWDLRQEKVAHVHAHFAHQATQVAMLASMLSGISFSFTGHAKDVYTARPRNLKEKVEMAAFAVTCTGANQTYLRSLVAPVDREKIEFAYHGVDIEKFSPDIGSSDSDEAAPLVLSVGRLVAKRGLLTSLRLWRASEQTVCSFARCLSERDRTVECWSNAGGTPGSMMFWKCPAPAARRPWSISIVVPLSSRCPCRVLRNGDRDGIPNVLMEAMAMAIPVVSTSISGIPELVTSGENGLLMPERDPSAFSSSLESVIRDRDLARRLGQTAAERSVIDLVRT